MSRIFADACYWIALINRDDELRAAALAARTYMTQAKVFTTDEVLCEVLNYFSKQGSCWREKAAEMVEGIRKDARVVVDAQSRETFNHGLELYKNRKDKGYSLVDCISFGAMRHHGITKSLTNDRHFEQEQFVVLLRQDTPQI